MGEALIYGRALRLYLWIVQVGISVLRCVAARENAMVERREEGCPRLPAEAVVEARLVRTDGVWSNLLLVVQDGMLSASGCS